MWLMLGDLRFGVVSFTLGDCCGVLKGPRVLHGKGVTLGNIREDWGESPPGTLKTPIVLFLHGA